VSHSCAACIVTCEDFRLHRRDPDPNVVDELLRRAGGPCDLITRAGAVQDLLRGPAGFADSLLRDLRVSVELHQIRRIYLVNHADCGAYQAFAFPSGQEERRQHEADLRQAAQLLRRHFPAVAVTLLFAALTPGSRDRFRLEEVPPAGPAS